MPFSFSIFDDTDNSTVVNTAPVYDLLEELGLGATKSVWVLRGPGNPGVDISGLTLEDPAYLSFVLDLQRRGFEIALHGVQNGSAERSRIERGLAEFEAKLGHPPRLHTNHSRNRDNLYWGPERFASWAVRELVGANRFGRAVPYAGNRAGSPYFWGDLARARVKYVRNLVFNETNLNRVNPSMPYHDPRKPYVPYWFSGTDGGDVQRFCAALSEQRQDELEAEEGVCIMYAHFASGFAPDGKVDARFAQLMRRLAGKAGTLLPVGALLDKLLVERGGGAISRAELGRMEWRWLLQRLARGGS